MNRIASVFAILIVGMLALPAAARQWASRDGKFTVEAELVDVRDGKVILRKSDGSLLTSPLDKLSLPDVQYVNEVLKATEADSAPKAEPASKNKPLNPAVPMGSGPRPLGPARLALPARQLDPSIEATLADLNSGDDFRIGDRLKLLSETGPPEPNREVAKTIENVLMTSTDRAQRTDAAKAMKSWSTEESIPVMVRTLKAEKSIFILTPLIEALAKYKSESAIEPIAEQLLDISMRRTASETLKAYGPIAEDAVLAQLQVGDHFSRIEVCDVLRMIGTRKSFPALEQTVKDPDVFVSRAAVNALHAIRSSKRVPVKAAKTGAEAAGKSAPQGTTGPDAATDEKTGPPATKSATP